MAQTKKDGVREAILQAAFGQFSEVGYSETSIPAIAAAAGISTANVYRLLPLEAADPLHAVRALAGGPARRARRVAGAHRRPAKAPGEAPARALARAAAGDQRLRQQRDAGALDQRPQRRLRARTCGSCSRAASPTGSPTPPRLSARESQIVAGVALMAFDGFAMNVHLPVGIVCDAATAAPDGPHADRPRRALTGRLPDARPSVAAQTQICST